VAAAARVAVQRAASEGPGVIRDAAGLARAAAALAAVPTDADTRGDVLAGPALAEWETTNLHQVATALTHVAALRTETRGGHYREDFPDADDAWRLHQVLRLDGDGALEVTRRPV
jgi:L-aspartate oxidase